MGAEVVQPEREIAKVRATRLGWILIGHACLGVGLLGVAIPRGGSSLADDAVHETAAFVWSAAHGH
jgi:hypothetical protein